MKWFENEFTLRNGLKVRKNTFFQKVTPLQNAYDRELFKMFIKTAKKKKKPSIINEIEC